MAIPRTRPGNYPAFLSYGFRPFFLLAALQAAGAILLWIPLLYGQLETRSALAPLDWHIHEMLFGYLAAVVTGFLLTAIPNWTGRLPVQGLPLLGLVLLWVAGRVAVFLSADIGWLLAAAVDCAFLLAVGLAAAVEIVAGRNWRNLKVLVPVGVLIAANVAFHLEAHLSGLSDISRRLGIGAAIVLIMIIGGRIIPSFTRNWLVRENPGWLPAPFGRFDIASIAVSAAALAAWAFVPEGTGTGIALTVAALFNVVRLGRWAGHRTLRDGLVLVLHVSYAFVPVGLLLAGLTALEGETVPQAAAVHTFGVGAIGCMTLAVMTRATLGHTGRQLRAGGGTVAIYAAIILSALLRITAAFGPGQEALVHASAGLWAAAFFTYAALYGGMLLRPRLKPRQPNRVPA